jgi:ABC-type glutathione transport system ATPase component
MDTMATQPASKPIATQEYGKPAKAVLLDSATNEVVFAVVGYVGSGTSEIASALKGLLEQEKLEGGKFDVEILKAREVISDWATRKNA